MLQPAKLRSWLDTELVGKNRPNVTEGGERLGLTTGSVQSDHELRVQRFAVGVTIGQRLQFGNGFTMPPECQLRIESLLGRREPKLVHPPNGHCGERHVSDVAQGFAAHQGDRVGEQPACRLDLAPTPCVVGLPHQRLETGYIDRSWVDVQ